MKVNWPSSMDDAVHRYNRLEREGVAPPLQARPSPERNFIWSDRHCAAFPPECFAAMVVGFEAKGKAEGTLA